MSAPIDAFEKLLAAGRDDALLRFALGQAYCKAGRYDTAEPHLASAVDHDPNYSAAWKLLGKARSALGDPVGAAAAYRSGIAAAERSGDKQAAREMRVFLRRIEKSARS